MAKVKKSVAKKIPKAANPKKSSKPTQLDAKLHQTFLTSLASLETFWAKKVQP